MFYGKLPLRFVVENSPVYYKRAIQTCYRNEFGPNFVWAEDRYIGDGYTPVFFAVTMSVLAVYISVLFVDTMVKMLNAACMKRAGSVHFWVYFIYLFIYWTDWF